MVKVLVCAFNYEKACVKGQALLEEAGLEILYNPGSVPFTKRELLRIIPDIDAAISGNEIWDEEVYRQAKKLKVIARFGVGVDNIDLEGAKAHNIYVCNAPGSTNGVAELVISWMLMLSRHLVEGNNYAKKGEWTRYFGSEIRGKKIGFLGYGRIPKLISRKLANFDAELYAYDAYPDKEYAKQYGVTMTDMDHVLEHCDIISLHIPATPQTKNFMDEKKFSRMKKGSIFINTSRGSNVDEVALYNALTTGHLSGAACDVFAVEPVQADNKLLSLENFYCTPHWGSDTYETLQMVGEITATAVVDVLCHKSMPANLLNR